MTSNDIRIVINGQQFVVDGQSLKPAPENDFQQEVMKRFDGLESRMDKLESRMGRLENRMTSLEHQQDITNSRLDMGIWSAGICFGVLALVIAFVGVFAPKFWEHMTRKEHLPSPQTDIDILADRVAELLSQRYDLKPKH